MRNPLGTNLHSFMFRSTMSIYVYFWSWFMTGWPQCPQRLRDVVHWTSARAGASGTACCGPLVILQNRCVWSLKAKKSSWCVRADREQVVFGLTFEVLYKRYTFVLHMFFALQNYPKKPWTLTIKGGLTPTHRGELLIQLQQLPVVSDRTQKRAIFVTLKFEYQEMLFGRLPGLCFKLRFWKQTKLKHVILRESRFFWRSDQIRDLWEQQVSLSWQAAQQLHPDLSGQIREES